MMREWDRNEVQMEGEVGKTGLIVKSGGGVCCNFSRVRAPSNPRLPLISGWLVAQDSERHGSVEHPFHATLRPNRNLTLRPFSPNQAGLSGHCSPTKHQSQPHPRSHRNNSATCSAYRLCLNLRVEKKNNPCYRPSNRKSTLSKRSNESTPPAWTHSAVFAMKVPLQ